MVARSGERAGDAVRQQWRYVLIRGVRRAG